MPTSGRHIIGVEFTKERMGEYREGVGPLKLYIDDQMVAESEIRTVLGHFSLCGEGLCIGYDSGDPVSSMYASRFEFTGGEITKVVFDIADDAYVDVEAPPRRGDGARLTQRQEADFLSTVKGNRPRGGVRSSWPGRGRPGRPPTSWGAGGRPRPAPASGEGAPNASARGGSAATHISHPPVVELLLELDELAHDRERAVPGGGGVEHHDRVPGWASTAATILRFTERTLAV